MGRPGISNVGPLHRNFCLLRWKVPSSTVVFFWRGTVPIDIVKNFPTLTDMPQGGSSVESSNSWSPLFFEVVKMRSSTKLAVPIFTSIFAGNNFRSLSTIMLKMYGNMGSPCLAPSFECMICDCHLSDTMVVNASEYTDFTYSSMGCGQLLVLNVCSIARWKTVAFIISTDATNSGL
ncbi:hypothetical protein QLX08_005520 [Tetragonisca angustula]|uniref:Uncharacterized protein n=1 Tax=Tetragonisca angustula TaxID=166442 RepID=A0AAW0ZY82_9HYME